MRKIMKRNIQRQRQQRSVTYMRTEQDRQVAKSTALQHAAVSLVVGLFMAWVFLAWLTGGN